MPIAPPFPVVVCSVAAPAGPRESVPADAVLTRMQLRRALGKLDEKKRLALVLHWYLDLPLEEIATITGSSEHAVEGRLRRGMQDLRHRMEEQRG